MSIKSGILAVPNNAVFGLIVLLSVLFLPDLSFAADVTMAWTANDPIENVSGYKIYYGSASRFDANLQLKENFQYDFVINLKNKTRCEVGSIPQDCTDISSLLDCTDLDGEQPTCTYSGLEPNSLYYFTATAFNDRVESDYCQEEEYQTSAEQNNDQPEANLDIYTLSPDDEETVAVGEVILSCQAVSATYDISNITLISDLSGEWQQDYVHYVGEISSAEAGLTGLYHFNDTAENSISAEYEEETNIIFSQISQFGSSAYFSGYDSRITVEDTAHQYDITDELTIEAWVYPTAITEWDYIVSKAWDDHTAPYVNYALGFYNNTGRLRFAVAIGGQQYMVTTDVISPNQWYHVAGVYSSSKGKLQIYLNGSLVNETAVSGALDTTATELIIGGYQYSQNESWNGYIDELAIYAKALSAEEISAHQMVDFRQSTAYFPVNLSTDEVVTWACGVEDVNGNTSFTSYPVTFTAKKQEEIPVTLILEDGEEDSLSQWSVMSGDEYTTVTQAWDAEQGNVISFNGDYSQFYKAISPSIYITSEMGEVTLDWTMKCSDGFMLNFNMVLNDKKIYVNYWQGNNTFSYGNTLWVGLGEEAWDGTWHSFTRNLILDLQILFPNVEYQGNINSLVVQGTGQLDNIFITKIQ